MVKIWLPKTIKLFEDKLTVKVSAENWQYLCENRFLSDNPSQEDIQSEFVSGTGISRRNPERWALASESFAEYIDDLREISSLDVNFSLPTPNG